MAVFNPRRGLATGLRLEYVLDSLFEQPRDLEREFKAGVVLAGLDRVYGLPRNAESIGQLSLRPASFGAALLEIVAHINCNVG